MSEILENEGLDGGEATQSLAPQYEETPLVAFDYSVTNAEEDKAFRLFQRKFVYKQKLFQSVLFLVPFGLFLRQIIVDPSYTMGWCLSAVCLGIIASLWLNQIKIRKTLMTALLELENDVYRFKLYDNSFSIETIAFGEDRFPDEYFIDDENADDDNTDDDNTSEADEESFDKPQKIEPKLVSFGEKDISVCEADDMFVIFIEKETIYVLPKREMDDYQRQRLTEQFETRLGENFFVV